MTTSLSTRSTTVVSRRAIPSRPPVATSTSQPSCVSRSRSDWHTPRSSSTTKMRMPLSAGEILARGVLRAVRHLGQLVHDVLDALERRVDRVETLPLDHEVFVRGDTRHVRL